MALSLVQGCIEQGAQRFDHWVESRSTRRDGSLLKRADVYRREAEWFNAATIATIISICLPVFGVGGILGSLAFFSFSAAFYLGRAKIGQLLDARWEILREEFTRPVMITKGDAVWDLTLKKADIEFFSLVLFKDPGILNWPTPRHVDDVIEEGKRRLRES